MSGYAAVNEAFRLAAKENDLLRQAIRQKAEKASLKAVKKPMEAVKATAKS